MLTRAIGWSAGVPVGASLALFLANWAGAPLADYLPQPIFMVVVQTGYVTFLLLPLVAVLVSAAWVVRRLWPPAAGGATAVPSRRPLLVLGLVLGGLIAASHGLLWLEIRETNERLQAIEGAQGTGFEPAALPPGVTTSFEIHAGPIEVVAPDGEMLTGVWELDVATRTLVVAADDERRQPLVEIVEPRDFLSSEAIDDMPNAMLLELYGWPRERWPEGWSP